MTTLGVDAILYDAFTIQRRMMRMEIDVIQFKIQNSKFKNDNDNDNLNLTTFHLSPLVFSLYLMALGRNRYRPKDGSAECVEWQGKDREWVRAFAGLRWHIGCMWV